MSEYQYYEFAALDRPLTRAEMDELRAISTRAAVSPTRFVNHYEWGDLRADPADWMRRYFDAFVYTANWCSCRFALRLPLATFTPTLLEPYDTGYAFTAESTASHWVLHWSLDESEDHGRFSEDDGRGWMGRLLPLRDEIMRGDWRPLWLAGAGELQDAVAEPGVPPGLADLSPSQQALAEFLALDIDMLAAASAGSAAISPGEDDEHLDAWLQGWPRDEVMTILRLVAQGRSQEAEHRVRSRHAAWQETQRKPTAGAATRTVAELRKLAESASAARLEAEAKKRAQQDSQWKRLRESNLRRLMSDVEKQWAAIEDQARRGSGSSYEQAVRMLRELAEGYALTSNAQEFERALQRFLVRHERRQALLRRLTEAGLWPQ
jgi:hypothetical protein